VRKYPCHALSGRNLANLGQNVSLHVNVRLSTLGRWAGAIGGAILVLGHASRTILGERDASTLLVSGA
jgi:hypothetical protein